MITAIGPVTLHTPQDVDQNFEHYMAAKDSLHLDLVVRTPIGFEICDPTTTIVTYQTELLSGGTRLTAPYTSSAFLQLTDGTWKMSSIMNALGHHHWTGSHPYLSGEQK